jgi:NAD(P)-dependent dehydrogenase (short-subunit alcohol dehydrogenase family)
MSFGDKSAVVTGGAAWIGRAAAEMLARGGASIIIAGINQALGEETAAAVRAEGG